MSAGGPRFDRLDLLRALAMVWMAGFHFCFDLNVYGYFHPRQAFTQDPFWTVQRSCIVSLFLLCAGMGQALALQAGQGWPRFRRRWLQVAGCALLVSIGSAQMFPNSWIHFGVLHGTDVLVEDAISKMEDKIEKEAEKGAKRFGESFNKEMFLSTNPRVLEYQKKVDEANARLKEAMSASDMSAMRQLLVDLEIADPVSGTRNWTDVRQFNLMFSTDMGSIAEDANKIFLRPETAQGIFVNFLNVQKTGRMKLPFGIAQIGKAFRNEIVARQFIFRMREFEQMEMQFFIRPGEEMKWYEHWKEKRMKWHQALGLGGQNYRFHDHLNLAHYANAACDIQFNFPMGFKELEGIHSRTDFDLKSHEKYSGKKLQYFDPETNQSYIPYVVETSVGLDRLFLAVLSNSYKEEKVGTENKEDESERVVLSIPAALAPNKVAVLPLVKKDGLPEKASAIFDDLKFDLRAYYEDKDTIGRRYRRMDAIGTPYCVTIDHQTLQDDTVTLRDRDTMKQERVSVRELKVRIQGEVSMVELLKKI